MLYSGFMAASESLGDPKFRDAMEAMGKKYDWQLRSHLPDADDQSVGQTYLELYLRKKDATMMKPTRAELDALLEAPQVSKNPGPNKPIVWWWCDALFMAPAVWARDVFGDGGSKVHYVSGRGVGEDVGSALGPQEHLYARDADVQDEDRGEWEEDVLGPWQRLGDGWDCADGALSAEG